jgi:hypothetical protein
MSVQNYYNNNNTYVFYSRFGKPSLSQLLVRNFGLSLLCKGAFRATEPPGSWLRVSCAKSLYITTKVSCSPIGIYPLTDFIHYRPGHFSRILSAHYGSKIKITAIDANENVINKAKELSAGLVEGSVVFKQADFNKYSDGAPYDVIVFTKSFHHCLPITEVCG